MKYSNAVSRKLAHETMAFKTGNYVLLKKQTSWGNPSRYMAALFAHECAMNVATTANEVAKYADLANKAQQ